MTRDRWIGLVLAVVAALLAIFAVYGDSTAPQSQKDSLNTVVPFVLVVAAILFGLLIPWAKKRSPAMTGLIISILGFLSLAAFWSGLPIVLGGAGATLGLSSRESVAGRGKATAAIAVGAGAVIVGLLVTVLTTLVFP